MAEIILKVLLSIYAAYALLKFFDFFFVGYDRRMVGIRAAYEGDGRVLRVFDHVMLVFCCILVGLLVFTRVHALSFVTGLLVGMTLIQVYFHRFNQPLTEGKAPPQPVSAIKLMSWSIQAAPGLAWRELGLMTAMLIVGVLGLWLAPAH